jgi:hypothetical protein
MVGGAHERMGEEVPAFLRPLDQLTQLADLLLDHPLPLLPTFVQYGGGGAERHSEPLHQHDQRQAS